MAKGGLLNVVLWIVGVLVGLAVGFGMISGGPLNSIPFIPGIVVSIAGWIVIVGVILGVIMAIVDAIR